MGMLPAKAIRLSIGDLIAADTTLLAPATANKIALVTQPVTQDEDLTMAALTLATFTGSTPKAGASGTQGSGINPATGQQRITILTPVGGWRWVCTADPVTPETIYAIVLTDTTLADFLGIEVLAEPVEISEAGQEFDAGAVEMDIVLEPIS